MLEKNLELDELIRPQGIECVCGKRHSAAVIKFLAVEPGCIAKLPQAIKKLGVKKPFLIMGENGRDAAGYSAMELLRGAGSSFSLFCFPGREKILPNEESMAAIDSAFDNSCDFILGVGSGVINDLCKMVAFQRKLSCGIVATAPSMDGYASNSSAMELEGIKTTVYTVCPSLILCDTEIMRHAPDQMLSAGFGDMAAKIISIADWRIAHLITGEYYCGKIAELMLEACGKVLNNVSGISCRDEYSVRQLTEGLILSGVASSFAGVSRPASGMEHTLSHLLEMFALAGNRQPESHGIQVAYGTRVTLKLYRHVYDYNPSLESFERAMKSFDHGQWEKSMKKVFGAQADSLICASEKSGRNSYSTAQEHFSRAMEHWQEIREIAASVLKKEKMLLEALDAMHLPQIYQPELLGFSREEINNAVIYSRDLRDRYILSSLCWDIGMHWYSSLPPIWD